MAGELGPTTVNNGGGGTVNVGGITAPDYRQVQAPAQVDTNLPNSEAAYRAAALKQAFEEFEGVSAGAANKLATQAGALAGAASGQTGHPQYKQGLARLTAYGQAFNNAATGAYAVEAEAQADDTAARLRVQANGDPAVFAKTYSAVRDGVLKEAPALARPMLAELYNKRLAEGLDAVATQQQQIQRQTQRQIYQVGIDRQVSRVAMLQGSINPVDQAEARDEHVKLSLLISGGVKEGLFTAAEGQAMQVNAMRQITEQVAMTQFDRELQPGGDPVGYLERFRSAHLANMADTKNPPILSEDEYNKLSMTMKQKLIQSNMANALARRDGHDAQLARFQAGDAKYTAEALAGTLSLTALSNAVLAQDITPETARAVRSLMINRNEVPKSSPAEILKIQTRPDFLDMTDREIASEVDPASALKLITERDRRNNSWEGTQQAKDARAVIMNALKLPKGPALMFSPEQQRAASTALIDFTARMNKIDPAHRQNEAMTVAQQVVADEDKKQAAAAIVSLQSAMQRNVQQHGPDSDDPWDAAKMKAVNDPIQQHILQLQRQVQGK